MFGNRGLNVTLLALSVLLAILIILLCFTAVFAKYRSKKTLHPYRQLNTLLTPAERSFYGVLTQTVNGNTLIFAKVRVADVLTPKRSTIKVSGKRHLIRYQPSTLTLCCVKKMT